MSRARMPASRVRLGNQISISDALLAFGSPLLAYFLRDPNILQMADLSTLLIYAILSALVSTIAFRLFRIAQGMPRFFSFQDAIEIAKASFVSVTVISAILFTFTRLEDLPRSVPIIHFLLLTGSLIAARLVRRALCQRTDRSRIEVGRAEEEEAVLLVGVTRLAWFYVRIIDMFGLGHRRVLGLLDANAGLVGRSVFGHIVLGSPEDAATLAKDFAAHGTPIRAFVICERGRHSIAALRTALTSVAREYGIAIEPLAKQLGIEEDDEQTSAIVRVPAQPTQYLRVRRVFDAIASGVAILALAPLLLIVAAGVRFMLDAPVIFWQRRVGRDGRAIHIYKFRSMRNPLDRAGRMLSVLERASTFGNFLRATRLDELPQLYNVLRGDMALIGPRPLLPVDQPRGASLRLSVAPGITGWAQTNGGKLVSADEKNALDEYYVRNASVWLDARILGKTMRTVFFGDRRDEAMNASTQSNVEKPPRYDDDSTERDRRAA